MEAQIDWEFVPRLEPGVYRAYCRTARTYRDRVFKRWVCSIQFDIFSGDLMNILGRLTLFLNLGSEDRPHATRRKKFWKQWTLANGAPPQRNDRMSPRIFTKRYALVRVADTTKDARQQVVADGHAYSVVTEVLEWETGIGNPGQSPRTEPSVDVAIGDRSHAEKSCQLVDVDVNANHECSGSPSRPLPGSGNANTTHPKGGRAAKAARPSKASAAPVVTPMKPKKARLERAGRQRLGKPHGGRK
jgi:hypothetical protein